MSRPKTTYYVDWRPAPGKPWVVHNTDGLAFLGWAVSEMNRRADKEGHLDWRVRTGTLERPQIHRLRQAGQARPVAPTAHPAGRSRPAHTIAQSWRRLPPVPEDDPF